MTIPPETLNFARQLLAFETVAGESSMPMESPTLRVYEKLRLHLSVLAGVAGFQLLASRALTLSKSGVPSLSAVQVTPDGRLQRLRENDSKAGKGLTEAEGAIFIGWLLVLLLSFIGKALTMRLIQDVWPNAAFDDMQLGGGRKA